MLLAVDIGNSSIDFGVFGEDGVLQMKSKASVVKTRSADEYAVILNGILQLHQIPLQEITGCIIASVVPPLTAIVSSAVKELLGLLAIEVGPGIKTGLKIRIDSQTELGADLVANAVAAVASCSTPIVIVDLGTATTFTVLDGNGVLEGVIIAPGLRMSLDALSAGASELPDVSLASPKRLIAKNSQESMNVGVLYGHAFLIDGFLEEIRRTLRVEQLHVVVTGGLADTVLPFCRWKMERRPDLTLCGLWLLYQKNRK